MDLCGHGTLASAYSLFSNGLVDSDKVEFVTQSGILTTKRVPDTSVKGGSFLVEMNFPVIPTCELYNSSDIKSMFSKALNGATIVDVRGTTKDKLVFQPLKGATKSTSTDQIMVMKTYNFVSLAGLPMF